MKKHNVKLKGRGAHVKIYQHVMIITSLVLFTMFFYRDGFGSISFLFAAGYLVMLFIKEIKRYKKSKEI